MWRGAFLGTAAAGIACAAACSSFNGDAPVSEPADGGADQAAPFCDGVDASLCESFDKLSAGSPFVADLGPMNTLTFDDVASSKPGAARLSQATTKPVALTKTLEDGLAFVTCKMQVRLEPGDIHDILKFSRQDKVNYVLRAEKSQSKAVVLTLHASVDVDAGLGGALQPSADIGTAPINTYVQIALTYDTDGGLSASLGDSTSRLSASKVVADAIRAGRPRMIRIGPEADDGIAAAMRVDDVVCDWHQ